jgi:hypothetical protein
MNLAARRHTLARRSLINAIERFIELREAICFSQFAEVFAAARLQ